MENSARIRTIQYLLGILLSLVVADGLITQFLIKNGIGYEGNPFLKVIVTEGEFLVIKLCGVIVSVIILWNMAKRLPKLIYWFSSFLVFIYTVILLWNIAIYFVFGMSWG